MRGHTANELRDKADVNGANTLPVASGVRVGVEDLTGRRLEQAQLISSETTHLCVMRYSDVKGSGLDFSCYLVIDDRVYVVDFILDPRVPRPKMWAEVYCHAIRGGMPGAVTVDIDGGIFGQVYPYAVDGGSF